MLNEWLNIVIMSGVMTFHHLCSGTITKEDGYTESYFGSHTSGWSLSVLSFIYGLVMVISFCVAIFFTYVK